VYSNKLTDEGHVVVLVLHSIFRISYYWYPRISHSITLHNYNSNDKGVQMKRISLQCSLMVVSHVSLDTKSLKRSKG